MEKFILIDGAGLIYRSFYAVPAHLKNPQGEAINAVLGFTNILLNILDQQKPDYIAVAFDKKGPTFRHEAYKKYKATRVKAPQELYDQIPKVKEVVAAFDIPMFELDGYEADDIIATAADEAKKKNVEVLVATGDFDIFQIVGPHVKILYPEKSFREANILGREDVVKKYGIQPEQIPDFKGLCGDTSDNIPGVYGIGEKTATSLLRQYGTLENVYKHLDEIPEKFRKKLESDKDNAFFSKKLATLIYETPLHFSLEDCRKKSLNPEKILPLFEKFGFRKILDRLKPFFPKTQESLF